MVEYVGAATRLAYSTETTFGTKVTPARLLGISHQTIDFPDKTLDVKQYHSFGAGRKWFQNKAGRRERTGSIPFLPTTGAFMYFAFGQDTSSGSSPTVHVMAPKTAATLPSFSLGAIYEGSPNFMRTFVGCTVDSLSMSLSEGGELQATMDIMAQDVQDEDTASPTLFTQPTTNDTGGPSVMPYMFYDRAANVTLGGSLGTITSDPPITGGRTIARVKGFSWSIRNNLQARWFSQASNPQNPFAFYTSYPDFDLSIDITPAGKISADTDAIYDLLEGESKADVLIPFQRSSTDKLYIVALGCLMRSAPHSFPDDGGEVSTTVTLVPEEIRVVSRDGIADYDTL